VALEHEPSQLAQIVALPELKQQVLPVRVPVLSPQVILRVVAVELVLNLKSGLTEQAPKLAKVPLCGVVAAEYYQKKHYRLVQSQTDYMAQCPSRIYYSGLNRECSRRYLICQIIKGDPNSSLNSGSQEVNSSG
jgi:hypothetical protein